MSFSNQDEKAQKRVFILQGCYAERTRKVQSEDGQENQEQGPASRAAGPQQDGQSKRRFLETGRSERYVFYSRKHNACSW